MIPCLRINFKFYFWFYLSDPIENDFVEGLRPNARGPGLFTFGVILFLSKHLFLLDIFYFLEIFVWCDIL